MKKDHRHSAGRFAQGLAHQMDYPVDAFLDIPSMHFTGSSSLVVEGCRSLLEYSDTRITFDLGDFTASLFGSGLVLGNLSSTAMDVTGAISSLTFDKRAEK